MVAFLAALGGTIVGAIVGAMVTWVFAVWRAVVEGQAAAKVMRYEILQNRTKIAMALDGKTGDMTLSDDAWRLGRLLVAPLIREADFFDVWAGYAFVPQAQRFTNALLSNRSDTAARKSLETWKSGLTSGSTMLINLEFDSRAKLMMGLMRHPKKAEYPDLASRLLAKIAAEDGDTGPSVPGAEAS